MVRLGFAAATLSLIAVPALAAQHYPAQPPSSSSPFYSTTPLVTGDVALSLGAFDNGNDTSLAGVASGRVNIPFGAGWDEELEANELGNGDYSTFGVFSHTYIKDPSFAAGFVFGASSLNGDGAVTAGVEGAAFMPASRLVGALTYNWGSGNTDDFWTASGEGDWYFDPNDKLSGKVAYFNGGGDGWMLTAGAEHRFSGTSLGMFGSLSYLTYSQGSDQWQAMAGAHIYFDNPGSTLEQFDWSTPFAVANDVSFVPGLPAATTTKKH